MRLQVSAAACISILLGCTVLFGIEYKWPVRNISLTATFGEDRWGHFHSGIDLGGGEQEIYSCRGRRADLRLRGECALLAAALGYGKFSPSWSTAAGFAPSMHI